MANVYEYHAPQFRDFNSGFDDSDEADKFFGKIELRHINIQ